MRGLALAVCACAALPMAWGAEKEPQPPSLGARMPEFVLFDLQHRPHRLSDVQEPVLVLNFFAFWCDTWIDELPQLRELAAQQDDLGFKLLSITVDGAWTDQLDQVCGEEGVPFPVLVDRDSVLSASLGLRHIPTIMVLDGQRTVRFVYEAFPGKLVLLHGIRSALSARASSTRSE